MRDGIASCATAAAAATATTATAVAAAAAAATAAATTTTTAAAAIITIADSPWHSLLDARFFRTPYSRDSPTLFEGTVLGAEQWRWLDALLLRGESPDDDAAGADASSVRAVVVVSGMTVLGESHRHVMAGLAVGEGGLRWPGLRLQLRLQLRLRLRLRCIVLLAVSC